MTQGEYSFATPGVDWTCATECERMGSSRRPSRNAAGAPSYQHRSQRAAGCHSRQRAPRAFPRRAAAAPAVSFNSRFLLVALATLLLLIGPSFASPVDANRSWQRTEVIRLARDSQLVEGRAEPEVLSRMQLEERQNRGRPVDEEEETTEQQDEEEEDTSTTIRPPTSTSAPTRTPTSAASTTSSVVIQTDDTYSNAALPAPFDTSLGKNFTSQTCPTFFSNFLSNGTFQECLPFSLLLKNSISFFQASKSSVRVTQTLDASCNVDFNMCRDVMSGLAQQITRDENCGVEFREQNPMVLQAHTGFVSYEPLFQAGCLRDGDGNYCFANAITNITSPSDSYPYYLPLGSSLPGGSRPTCNSCLQETMGAFSGFAGDQSLPLSRTYVDAARQINLGCGPSFVEENVASPQTNVGVHPSSGLATGLAVLFTLAAALL